MPDSIDLFFEEWSKADSGVPDLSADMQFVYRIAKVSKILGARLDETCAKHDLTRSQFEALAVLRRRYPDALSAGELMDASFLTSGSITAMVNQLLARNYVRRKVDKHDKRRIKVLLTAQGAKVIDAAVQERVQDNRQISLLLSSDKRESLNELMRTLLEKMEGETGDGHES